MKKIESFKVDHTKIDIGMYISRIDDNIVTYDVRMVLPNGGIYLDMPGVHTVEHLFATYARNTDYPKNIVYVGPMGCRTGFYFITKDLQHEIAIKIVRDAFEFVLNFEGEIPGATEIECGNYLEHDLKSAKAMVLPIFKKLQGYNVNMLQYPV